MDRGYLKSKPIYTLMLASALFSANNTHAQFKKYESKPRLKKAAVTNKNNNINSLAGEVDSNTKTFGDRSEPMEKNEQTSKYVQLNPETAFGPEIVTSFDFPDADIMEVTKHMQKLTGLNLILDNNVKGKVSISAPNPITVGDAWRAYLAALNMVNLTIVKTGAFYKIMQVRDIRYVPTKIYTGSYTPDTEQHVMKIISLKNVDANEISRNFRPFMSRYGRIIDMKQTNTVIISDTGANISRLEKLIKFLDVPGHEESLQIIPVENTSAQEIAKLLDDILKGSSSSSRSSSSRTSSRASSRFSSSSSKNKNISKIIAEPRTNSIIAMANAEGAKELRNLIAKLDVRGASTNSDKIHVHYLNFGNAEELAKTLSSLVSGAAAKKPTGSSRNFVPRNSNGSSLFNGEVKVTADKNNNALVVTASATDWLTLKSVIKKLDIPRDQVYVEGMIVETALTKVRAFGTEYYGAYGTGAAARGGFTNGSGGLLDLIATGGTSLSGLFIGGGGGGTVDIPNPAGGDPISVNSVNGLITAVATNANSNVLATPQILAMDNTEAEFEVGTTVPVVQRTTTNGTVSESIANQEAKLSLKITPQINKVTKYVKLKIQQTVNDFRGEIDTSGNGAITDTRSANTEIMVKDRDTVAMGGLLRDKETVNYNKVPLLGDIPVLGWLFKNKSRKVEKTNLLFFLTPRIITPDDNSSKDVTRVKLAERKEHLEKSLTDGQAMPFEKKLDKLDGKLKQGSLKANNIPNYKNIEKKSKDI
ncbi:MAG: type II secretion system secretin GspD [Bacteriovoracaceae bacterium]|jgi:general secretion pathway protein D|nr:type II secretion system secretin GspD [Bacteriovoracaceae bacterium]